MSQVLTLFFSSSEGYNAGYASGQAAAVKTGILEAGSYLAGEGAYATAVLRNSSGQKLQELEMVHIVNMEVVELGQRKQRLHGNKTLCRNKSNTNNCTHSFYISVYISIYRRISSIS